MNELKYPIYIPSKGRSNFCHTANLLKQYKINFKIVIEPQDYENYIKYFPKTDLLILPVNNMGLAFSRTFIKKYSIQNGENFSWQIDDDIKQFCIRIKNKNVKEHPLKIFPIIEKIADQYSNVTILGLRDAVFAWTQKTYVSYNKQISSAVLIKNNTPIFWNSNVIEDTDFSLTNLFKGYCTIIFNRYLYVKMPNNQAEGGLNSTKIMNYNNLQYNLVVKYPFLKIKRNNKNNKFKIAPSRIWSIFKQRPIP